MNCVDARECFSALLHGRIGLTERALVETHVSRCAECHQELEQLRHVKLRRRGGWRRRGRSVNKAPEFPHPRHVARRPQVFLRTLLWLLAGSAAVILITALALHIQGTPETQVAAHRPAPSAPARAADPPAVAVATQSPAESSAAADPVTPAAPPSFPRRVTARPAEPTRTQPAPAEATPVPAMDVIVQLSVKEPSVAARDLTALLARVGGTKLGRQDGFAFMVVVPQASYAVFTQGLAQIGSWQMQAGPSSLPDPVHVAVRLSR